MFSVSDVMIDKEEVSMTFQVPIHIENTISVPNSTIKDEQITIDEGFDSVSTQPFCVSKSHIQIVIQKIARIFATQGISCCECPKTQYKLYSLSDCKDTKSKYSLEIRCPDSTTSYQFERMLEQTNTDNQQPKNMKGKI